MKNECDELKLNLKAEQEIRERYEEEISRRGQELGELKTAKTDFIILTKKYEYLQSQYNDLKSKEIGKEVF